MDGDLNDRSPWHARCEALYHEHGACLLLVCRFLLRNPQEAEGAKPERPTQDGDAATGPSPSASGRRYNSQFRPRRELRREWCVLATWQICVSHLSRDEFGDSLKGMLASKRLRARKGVITNNNRGKVTLNS